jgi:hypothetical protein
MSKSSNRIGREPKKQPSMSPKEKKAAKRQKKQNEEGGTSFLSKVS